MAGFVSYITIVKLFVYITGLKITDALNVANIVVSVLAEHTPKMLSYRSASDTMPRVSGHAVPAVAYLADELSHLSWTFAEAIGSIGHCKHCGQVGILTRNRAVVACGRCHQSPVVWELVNTALEAYHDDPRFCAVCGSKIEPRDVVRAQGGGYEVFLGPCPKGHGAIQHLAALIKQDDCGHCTYWDADEGECRMPWCAVEDEGRLCDGEQTPEHNAGLCPNWGTSNYPACKDVCGRDDEYAPEPYDCPNSIPF